MKRLAAAMLALSTLPAYAFSGTITKVSDGDTVWVQPDDGQAPAKLRIQGIDAPERCQAWGQEAQAALAAKVLHQSVEITARERDTYGRLLGTLQLKGQDMGAWMVLQGHAWSYRYRHNAGPYVAQERQAQQAQRGLFAQPDPQEPRLFRRTHGPCP